MKRYLFFNSNKLYNGHGEHYNIRHVKVKIILYKIKVYDNSNIFFLILSLKMTTSTVPYARWGSLRQHNTKKKSRSFSIEISLFNQV